MGNKFTSDDFFRKAKEIWKDEYDYSNVVYKDYETAVSYTHLTLPTNREV